MSRAERLVLLAFFCGVVALAATAALVPAAVGVVSGLGAGLVVAPRLTRLRGRMDARLGLDEPPPRGLRPRRLLTRMAAHLCVLGVLLMSTVLIPFIGNELFAGLAAAVTAFPLVVTATGLRR